MIKSYKMIGGMAGSSMDGLDLAYVTFTYKKHRWEYDWIRYETTPYPRQLFQRLQESSKKTLQEQKILDQEFGIWLAEAVGTFLKNDTADIAAIHGHTVKHDPGKGISWQLGLGSTLSQILQIPVVTAFRNRDIELGGQGAPLVPFGDFELFNEFDACLNLGGICNLSIKKEMLAWDIAPCNQVLNHFAQILGSPFDENGIMGRQGTWDNHFMGALQAVSYFRQKPPKSLPNAFLSHLLDRAVLPKNGLFTYVKFLSALISKEIQSLGPIKRLLITGGGAYNSFLIENIRNNLPMTECIIPEEPLVSFKEALIFAFLGLKRFRNETNVLGSVTGAEQDSSSGVIHLPK